MMFSSGLFDHMPTLETERLVLRRLEMGDAQDIFDYGKDPLVAKHVLWDAYTSVSEARAYVKYMLRKYRAGEPSSWGIEEKATGRIIGTIGYMWYQKDNNAAEVGYSLSRDRWNRGYMTEACRAVTDYLFAEGFEKILIEADVRNSASREVIRKTGFIYDYSEKRVLSAAKPEEVTVNCYKMKSNLRRPADR